MVQVAFKDNLDYIKFINQKWKKKMSFKEKPYLNIIINDKSQNRDSCKVCENIFIPTQFMQPAAQ
jgi:hypothetical protein